MGRKRDLPSEVCACPTYRGSIKAAVIGGLATILTPMAIGVVSTYGVSADGLGAVPNAIYTQVGGTLMYFDYNPIVLYFTLIIAGLIMGALAGNFRQIILSIISLYFTLIVIFFVLELIYLGENTDWSRFKNIFTLNFLMASIALIMPSIIMGIIVGKRSSSLRSMKVKPIIVSHDIESPYYAHRYDPRYETF